MSIKNKKLRPGQLFIISKRYTPMYSAVDEIEDVAYDLFKMGEIIMLIKQENFNDEYPCELWKVLTYRGIKYTEAYNLQGKQNSLF